ncbi:50S ribosomal protein L24e [Candidatus Woesearchaeota archaeon]|nr:50S ribosomal protein L24e [Candidatus Woesearchaeota archaeon]
MVRCTFCGEHLEKGTGKMYVKKDGKIFYFCSMKCEKNTLKLNRKPRETRWTRAYALEKKPKTEEK